MSKITEKIAKLLALAESPYEEEAKAALLQARRLMAEHKLMPEDIEPQENKKMVQECVGVTWGFRPVSELRKAYADHIASLPSDILNRLNDPF